MAVDAYLGSENYYTDQDPFVGFMYLVEVSGKLDDPEDYLYFTECSGLTLEIEAIQHKAVTSTEDQPIQMLRQVVGSVKWSDITLKRGITSNLNVWDWRGEVEDGEIQQARADGSITMVDYSGAEEVAKWNFVNAWPSKVSGPSFKSDSNEFGVEEVVITHEGLERVV